MNDDLEYIYDGTFEGFLCCVYASFMRREVPGHIYVEEGVPLLGETATWIPTDWKAAQSVYVSLSRKIGMEAQDVVKEAFLTHIPNKEMILYRYICLGYRLGRLVLSEEDLLSGMNVYQKQENLALLGYTFGENRNTYPPLNHEKVSRFYELLGGMTDYLVVDCESDLSGNLLADMAVRNAGTVFGLLSPDLSSVGYRFSQLPLYPDELFRTNRHTAVLNHPRRDILWAEKEVRTLCPEVGLTLPYSGRLAAQSAEGTLLKETLDPRFEKAIRALAAKVP